MLRFNGRPLVEMSRQDIMNELAQMANNFDESASNKEAVGSAMMKLGPALLMGLVRTQDEFNIAMIAAHAVATLFSDGMLTFGEGQVVPLFEVGADGNLDIPDAFLRAFGDDNDGTAKDRGQGSDGEGLRGEDGGSEGGHPRES